MTRLERKEEEIGARLKSYASGNGALSFVYSDRHGRVTSDAVTLEDARDYMKEREAHLSHWIVGTFDSVAGPAAFHAVVRVGPKILVRGDRLYKYEESRAESFGITLWLIDGILGRNVEVKHISTKASVRFWLDNEKRCTELQK